MFSRREPQNEAKEKAPSTWPSAALAQRLSAAVPQTRPDKSGLKQCVTFIRIQPPCSAALNGLTKNHWVAIFDLLHGGLQGWDRACCRLARRSCGGGAAFA